MTCSEKYCYNKMYNFKVSFRQCIFLKIFFGEKRNIHLQLQNDFRLSITNFLSSFLDVQIKKYLDVYSFSTSFLLVFNDNDWTADVCVMDEDRSLEFFL